MICFSESWHYLLPYLITYSMLQQTEQQPTLSAIKRDRMVFASFNACQLFVSPWRDSSNAVSFYRFWYMDICLSGGSCCNVAAEAWHYLSALSLLWGEKKKVSCIGKPSQHSSQAVKAQLPASYFCWVLKTSSFWKRSLSEIIMG